MGTNYNLKTGLLKGVKFALTALVAIVAVTGFSDVTLWDLLEKYLKPLVGTLSVGGLLIVVQNWVKVKFGSYKKLAGYLLGK